MLNEPDIEGVGKDELDDRLWEDEGDDDEENSILMSAHKSASSSMMDDGVDVSIPQLCDFLSDHPTLEPLVKGGKAPNATKKVVDFSTPRVFQVPDMTF